MGIEEILAALSHTNAIQIMIMMALLHKAILVYTAQQLHCEVQSLSYIAH